MTPSRRLVELAKEASAQLLGDGDRLIDGVAPLDAAGPRDLSVFHHPRYREQFLATRAGAVIVRPEVAELRHRPDCSLLVSDDPYLSFAKVVRLMHRAPQAKPGRDPRAAIHPSASVDPSAEVCAYAFVGAEAAVGPGTLLHPFSHVGEGARLGAQCVLHAGAVVERACVLGDRVVLHAGAVVGSDGFGYAFDPSAEASPDGSKGAADDPGGAHLKVPQIGIVRIEDDVEIGANSCVDRAALGETVIGRGTKIDNLVQVAHSVRLGRNCALAAHTGISGSTVVGDGVQFGGRAGVADHVTVGDGARIAAAAGVMRDVPAGETWGGSPAQPVRQWMRQTAWLAKASRPRGGGS